MRNQGPTRAKDDEGERPTSPAPPLPRDAGAAEADRLARAIAASATELLRSLAADRSIPKVLALIGEAVAASRVQLYENERQADGRLAARLRHVWEMPGVLSASAQLDRAGQSTTIWERDRLLPFLGKGDTIGVLAREAKEPLGSFLRMLGVKSVLMAPVFVAGRWWGEIGFDDCRQERQWSALEMEALKTLAELVGAAIGWARDLEELSDAKRIIENSPVLLYRLGAKPPHPLVYVSRNIARYGYDAGDLTASPQRYLDLFHPDDLREIAVDIARVVSGQAAEVTRERRLRRDDGTYAWVEARMRGLYNDAHELTGIEGILIDIDEHKSAEAERARSARVDALTGLANRKAFMEELSRAFAAAKRDDVGFAVHYIDLDRFKDINDVLGHAKGDELLAAVAQRLVASRRSRSDLVARFGGDEFAILQGNIGDPSEAGSFAARLLRELAQPYGLGPELHITASIGIAFFARDTAGAEEMIKQADVALYRAKELGRNQYHFHSEALDAAVIERVMLGGDLRRALERGELELYYQPQIDLETRRIVGLEALVRWRHAKQGLLYPSRFIPIAEKNGTILPLGRWVADEVLRQIATWRAEQLTPPTIAINVSAEQLKAMPEFDRQLAERLVRWNVPASAIEIELTETVLMETTRQHGEVIDRLRALGVAIAIDDFGTGYSSLGYLRAYHVNHIKIAQEFVKDIQADSGDLAIVRAAVSLGRELGITVIAEGVENDHQLALLIKAGCRYVQGYYFSAPLTAARTAELLRHPDLPLSPTGAHSGAAS
jgi:diguanylate cyclase (GGDEF)-like protein/PAS domain S-box-containing protein